MPEKIIVNKELQIIEVISVGTITIDDMSSSLTAVEKISSETGFTKILVDTTRETSFPSIIQAHGFASKLPRGIMFAIIAKKGQPTQERVRFTETVAINRGFMFQLFTSKNEALEWLKD